ncbi:MAG: ankyrin repeat domain-containing protein [Gammaproteobacteria bacterium]|nr:ankyrin repeat domain-containing protein [Gammaproteobacteria bacterium]
MPKQKIPDIHQLITCVQDNLTDISTLENYLNQNPLKINRTTKEKLTPIAMACSLGNTNIVTLLLKYNPNLKLKGNSHCTPLHIAVIKYKTAENNTQKQNYWKIIKQLIEKDPTTLKCKEGFGKTARNFALKQNPQTPELAKIFDKYHTPKSHGTTVRFFKLGIKCVTSAVDYILPTP